MVIEYVYTDVVSNSNGLTFYFDAGGFKRVSEPLYKFIEDIHTKNSVNRYNIDAIVMKKDIEW